MTRPRWTTKPRTLGQRCMVACAIAAIGYGVVLVLVRLTSGLDDVAHAAVPLVVGCVYLCFAFLNDAPPAPHECPACGYDLTGNESGTCPECGWKRRPESGFDPDSEV